MTSQPALSEGMLTAQQVPMHLTKILRYLPPVRYAFAYGSGVMHQPGLYDANAADTASASTSSSSAQSASSGERPMIDYFVAVDDPLAWHEQNIKTNPTHYSWVAKLGAQAVCGIANNVGIGVHFNTLVRLENQLVKYGVISTASLEDDLLTWRYLYAAGRLHKPVAHILQPPAHIQAAQASNLRAAAATALLLLPPVFSTRDLLQQVVGLSYTGDVRMGVAEDPHKVSRITEGSLEALKGLYLPFLTRSTVASQKSMPSTSGSSSISAASIHASQSGEAGVLADAGHVVQDSQSGWRQGHDADSRLALLQHLPPALLCKVATQLGYQVPESHLASGTNTLNDVAWAAIRSNQLQQLVSSALKATVMSSSAYQAAAGAFAAGGGKAVEYLAAKACKALKANAVTIKEQAAAHRGKGKGPA